MSHEICAIARDSWSGTTFRVERSPPLARAEACAGILSFLPRRFKSAFPPSPRARGFLLSSARRPTSPRANFPKKKSGRVVPVRAGSNPGVGRDPPARRDFFQNTAKLLPARTTTTGKKLSPSRIRAAIRNIAPAGLDSRARSLRLASATNPLRRLNCCQAKSLTLFAELYCASLERGSGAVTPFSALRVPERY